MNSLFFPHETPPSGGELRQLAPGVLWLRMPLPFALDHINLWLLRDDAGWAVVDTGFSLDEVKVLWEKILQQLDAPITRILVTHFHPDHLGLASWLQEKYDVPLYMTAGEFLTAHLVWHELGGHGTAPMLAQFAEHGLDESGLTALQKRGNGYRRGVAALPQTYCRLHHGQHLQIGEHSWEIVTGYGHSPEHAMLYCRELAVLISGDMLLPKISTNISIFAVTPTDDALQRYLDSLSGYAAGFSAETLVLPSHGLPFRGVAPRVAELQAHHGERLDLLVENCHFPRSAAELLSTLFPRALDTHQTMFAMGEAIAHLNHLEQAGSLTRQRGADGIIRFTRANAVSAQAH